MQSKILQQLYAKYHKEIYLYLFSLCHNRELAEDLMQETFLKALLSLADAHTNVRAWLYLVARNLYFNHQNRERKVTYLEEIEEVLEDVQSDEEMLSADVAGIADIGMEKNGEAEAFTLLVKKTIRNAFIKTGIIVSVVVLAIVCFVIFAVPQIVDCFYYDPGKIAWSSEQYEGRKENQLSLDVATYSELFLPGVYRHTANVIGKGNAEYDVTIEQNMSYTGQFTDVSGTINKGKMILYNPNVLSGKIVGLVSNSFMPAEDKVQDYYSEEINYTKQDSLNALEDNQIYIAYMTLKDVVSFADFSKWDDENEVGANWCAICKKDEMHAEGEPEYCCDSMPLGFRYQDGVPCIGYDGKKYPLLTMCNIEADGEDEYDWEMTDENMKQHVISMLRYMDDQKEFTEMMGKEVDFQAWASNVEKYGLNIYGFVIIGDREEIQRVGEMDEVIRIFTHPME
ncbi:MAG: anti sigma factor C-terminal domain-containing protein [Eubacteriales bacterium]|nr:anti sigma factor C-terminal domain-containing protein [Eubacteriales bacterium]